MALMAIIIKASYSIVVAGPMIPWAHIKAYIRATMFILVLYSSVHMLHRPVRKASSTGKYIRSSVVLAAVSIQIIGADRARLVYLLECC